MPPRRKSTQPPLELILFPSEMTYSEAPDEPIGPAMIDYKEDKAQENLRYHECRICLENETAKSKMISPCHCLGSVKFIHERCLREWIQRSLILAKKLLSVECELCKCPYEFEIVRIKSCDEKITIQKKINENKKRFILLLILLIASLSGLFYLIVLLVSMLNGSEDASRTIEVGIIGLGAGLLIIVASILVGVIVSDFGFSAKWEVGKVKGNTESEENKESEERRNGNYKKNRKESHWTDVTMSPLQYSKSQILPMVPENEDIQ